MNGNNVISNIMKVLIRLIIGSVIVALALGFVYLVVKYFNIFAIGLAIFVGVGMAYGIGDMIYNNIRSRDGNN